MLENPTLVATTELEVELASELAGYCFAVGVFVAFKQRSPGKSVLRNQCLRKGKSIVYNNVLKSLLPLAIRKLYHIENH